MNKAREEIQRSSERLQVAQVDLLQLHNLVDPQEWEITLGPGGALEAAIEARGQGLVRFIGITGHGLTAAAMHRQALEWFDFDSVLLPYSYVMAQNEQYRSDLLSLIEIRQSRNVAVQTIKFIVHTPWGEYEPNRATWYRPLEKQADIDRAVHWVLGHTGLYLNSAGDVHILTRVVNNIYLDTIDMENYHANLSGIGERQKVRIRWYGDLCGDIVSPMLEFKVKSGAVGAKYSYTFAPFRLERGFSQAYLEKMINESDLPDDVQHYLRTLEAVLCNNYYRSYYASRDHRFMLTVDKDMAYYLWKKANNNFTVRLVDTKKTIVELKYEKQFDQHASQVSSFFPFCVTRSSKYVTGINFVCS